MIPDVLLENLKARLAKAGGVWLKFGIGCQFLASKGMAESEALIPADDLAVLCAWLARRGARGGLPARAGDGECREHRLRHCDSNGPDPLGRSQVAALYTTRWHTTCITFTAPLCRLTFDSLPAS